MKTRLEFFVERLPAAWANLLLPMLDEALLERLELRLEEASSKADLTPRLEQVLRALEASPPESVRVVILGQDPYPGIGLANGLAFSVSEGQKIPASLRNIFKELERDLPGSLSDSMRPLGDLIPWARQGVLLMNTHWTTAPGVSMAHADWGWDRLTDAVLDVLMRDPQPKVFLGWGLPAQARLDAFDRGDHPILRTSHPSPLSARKGFLGCGHFGETNRLLAERGRQPIDWRL